MATFDKTSGTAFSWDGLNKMVVLRNRIDMTGVVTANADVIQCLDIPANTFVQNVMVKVKTPKGGAVTATVGDGAGTSSFDGSTDLNAAAGTVTFGIAGTDAYVTTGGKMYATTDTIDLVVNGATAGAVFDVYTICIDLNM